MSLLTSAATLRICCAWLALTVLAFPAQAWNAVAHRTVAELAWRRMGPEERQAASDLLRQHPHYQVLLAVDVPAGVETNEWVFLNAAVWPDWVRPAKGGERAKPDSITKYDGFPHGIGYPFLRRGDTNTALLKNFFIAKPNAEMVLSNSLATLRDRCASAHDRAVSLCWALHLYGDLHQPLHTANLVTQDRLLGHRLGGELLVRNRDGERVSLHALWDGLFGTDFFYRRVAALADDLEAAPELQPSALRECLKNEAIPAWVQESFRAAVDFAYCEDYVQFVRADAVSSGKTAPADIPMLTADYVKRAREIARQRIALAGLRLSDALKEVWQARQPE